MKTTNELIYYKENSNFLFKLLQFEFLIFSSYFILETIAEITKSPEIVTYSFMFCVSLTIGIGLKGGEVIDIIQKRKYENDRKEILQKAVQNARLKENYTVLNKILMSKNSHLHIIELGFFINKYHNGLWLNKEKLSYPKEWGDNFFELSSKFFKEERERREVESIFLKKHKQKEKNFEYNDLKDFELQATFLSTVKPDIMKQLVDNL